MSYTDSLLASGERIVRRSRQHWFVMAWNSRWAFVAVIAAVALLILRLAISGDSAILDILGWVTLALFLVGIVVIAWGWIRYQNEEFVITSRRIIHSSGVINKTASDSSLEMINDAVLTESLFGRMFGFGDLDVLTASEAGIEKLRMLKDAKGFKRAMVEAKHELALEMERPTMPPIRTVPQGPAATATGAGPTITGDERPGSTGPGWGATAATGTPPSPPAAAAPAPAAAPEPAAEPPPSQAMSSEEAADALDRLGDLRDRGVVTPEEFEAKKRELLDRL
jgi:Bacterial PH domain/Short C-terminal domain